MQIVFLVSYQLQKEITINDIILINKLLSTLKKNIYVLYNYTQYSHKLNHTCIKQFSNM